MDNLLKGIGAVKFRRFIEAFRDILEAGEVDQGGLADSPQAHQDQRRFRKPWVGDPAGSWNLKEKINQPIDNPILGIEKPQPDQKIYNRHDTVYVEKRP